MTVKELIERLKEFPEDMKVECIHACSDQNCGGEVTDVEYSWYGEKTVQLGTD